MYSYKLNPFPKCAAVCNNCKWFKVTDKSDISTGIPSEKFGIGNCDCGKAHLLFGGWSPPRSLKRLNETCDRFEFDIHQKFGLSVDETDEYFNYIDFYNKYKIVLIRQCRQEKEAEAVLNILKQYGKNKTASNGTA